MLIPQHRPHLPKAAFVSRVADAFVILLASWAGAALHDVAWSDRYVAAAVLAVLLFHLLGESNRLYRHWRGASPRQYLWPVFAAWVWTGFGLFVLAWITKSTAHYSRVAVGLWMVFGLLGLMGWRMAGRAFLGSMRAHGHDVRRIVIAGAGERGRQLAEVVRSTPSLGLVLVGFFTDRKAGGDPGSDDRPEDDGPEDDGPREALPAPRLGDLDALVERARAGDFDFVYIALPLKSEDRIRRLVTDLSDTRAAAYIVADLFAHDLAHSRWTEVGPIPVISVFETPFSGIEGWIKRLEDLVLSVLILAAAALPMLSIAAAVKLTSPGPVLFRQRRNGLDGREITVWKFRTMTVQEDGDRVVQAVRGDGRVTPLGAFLRRASLDELPQLFNVLRGDMSIVGPRPHAVVHNEAYRRLIPGYMLRHRVKPGITGWAQIHGFRGGTDTIEKMEQRIRFDLWYIRNWSLWLDLSIIARTALRGIAGRNAY